MADVCAVTVTYGDRFESLCRTTIDRARAAGAKRIVVVDNGSHQASADALAQYAARHDDVDVIGFPENMGSAVGFAAGLEAAHSKSDLILLLDDDNWVLPDTLETLLSQRELLVDELGDQRVAVLAFRNDNGHHRRLRAGLSPKAVFSPPGAFLGIDLIHMVKRTVRERFGRSRAVVAKQPIKGLPYGPYGGMLVPAEALDEIGYPNRALRLYADDTEWTSRLRESGYLLVLSPDAEIEDADAKWIQGKGWSAVRSMLAPTGVMRLYYSTRNRTLFDAGAARRHRVRLRYFVNRCIVMAAVVILGFGKPEGRKAFLRGVRDGERSLRAGTPIDSLRAFPPLPAESGEEDQS